MGQSALIRLWVEPLDGGVVSALALISNFAFLQFFWSSQCAISSVQVARIILVALSQQLQERAVEMFVIDVFSVWLVIPEDLQEQLSEKQVMLVDSRDGIPQRRVSGIK